MLVLTYHWILWILLWLGFRIDSFSFHFRPLSRENGPAWRELALPVLLKIPLFFTDGF